MKRVLSLRKSVVIISALAGLLISASSFTFGPTESARLIDDPPQKKEQRVKLIINKDGKETKIDTTFNLADEKLVQIKLDSLLKTLNVEGVGSDNANIVIHRGGNAIMLTKKDVNNLPGNRQFEIMYQSDNSGETGQAKRGIHIGSDPFSFNPNDESVVSYDKKDIGKGLEKITIIRKKRPEHQQMKQVEVKAEIIDETKK